MTLGDLFGNFYGNSMVIDSTTGGTGFGKTPGAGLRVDINGATAIAGNTTISGATSILGNTTITGATTIAGKLTIIDGSQSSGALFTSNGSGVGTWIVPVAEQKTEWKYRAQNIQSNNNGVLSNHTELISAVLPALGSSDGYSFEVV